MEYLIRRMAQLVGFRPDPLRSLKAKNRIAVIRARAYRRLRGNPVDDLVEILDAQAIGSDWQAASDDLRNAFDEYEGRY